MQKQTITKTQFIIEEEDIGTFKKCLDYCYHRIQKHKCGIEGIIDIEKLNKLRKMFSGDGEARPEPCEKKSDSNKNLVFGYDFALANLNKLDNAITAFLVKEGVMEKTILKRGEEKKSDFNKHYCGSDGKKEPTKEPTMEEEVLEYLIKKGIVKVILF
jgi:hypothetical protein